MTHSPSHCAPSEYQTHKTKREHITEILFKIQMIFSSGKKEKKTSSCKIVDNINKLLHYVELLLSKRVRKMFSLTTGAVSIS